LLIDARLLCVLISD